MHFSTLLASGALLLSTITLPATALPVPSSGNTVAAAEKQNHCRIHWFKDRFCTPEPHPEPEPCTPGTWTPEGDVCTAEGKIEKRRVETDSSVAATTKEGDLCNILWSDGRSCADGQLKYPPGERTAETAPPNDDEAAGEKRDHGPLTVVPIGPPSHEIPPPKKGPVLNTLPPTQPSASVNDPKPLDGTRPTAALTARTGADKGILITHFPKGKCANICGPVVSASQACGQKGGTECICPFPKMDHFIPLCEACSAAADEENYGDFHTQVVHLRNTCGFEASDRKFEEEDTVGLGLSLRRRGSQGHVKHFFKCMFKPFDCPVNEDEQSASDLVKEAHENDEAREKAKGETDLDWYPDGDIDWDGDGH